MFITRKHISRRTVLRGAGAAIALPFLESMVPAMPSGAAQTQAAKPKVRVACMEMVHGSAGSTKYGIEKNMWAPAATGHDFDLTPSSLIPLDPWKDYVTIVSNTDMRPAEAYELHEVGGDHFRSSSVFLTQSHPKQTEGSAVHVATFYSAFDRKCRSGRWMRLRLFLRLHRFDQLGFTHETSSNGARPAAGL